MKISFTRTFPHTVQTEALREMELYYYMENYFKYLGIKSCLFCFCWCTCYVISHLSVAWI